MAVRNFDDEFDPLNPRNRTMPVPGNTGINGANSPMPDVGAMDPNAGLPPSFDKTLQAVQTPATPYQAKGPALGLEGFDNQKLASGHISPKYVFAKHAQGLGAGDTDELLRRLQGDESGYFKNSRFDGDKLIVDGALDPKFGGINTFDVIRGSKGPNGGEGWQWLDPNNAGVAPAGKMGGALPPDFMKALMGGNGMGGSDLMSQIQAEISKLLGGR